MKIDANKIKIYFANTICTQGDAESHWLYCEIENTFPNHIRTNTHRHDNYINYDPKLRLSNIDDCDIFAFAIYRWNEPDSPWRVTCDVVKFLCYAIEKRKKLVAIVFDWQTNPSGNNLYHNYYLDEITPEKIGYPHLTVNHWQEPVPPECECFSSSFCKLNNTDKCGHL